MIISMAFSFIIVWQFFFGRLDRDDLRVSVIVIANIHILYDNRILLPYISSVISCPISRLRYGGLVNRTGAILKTLIVQFCS